MSFSSILYDQENRDHRIGRKFKDSSIVDVVVRAEIDRKSHAKHLFVET